MIILLPYELEVPMPRWPWTNLVLIAGCILIFAAFLCGFLPDHVVEAMILDSWKLSGLFGSMFLHGGFVHLLGNMLFLWVFGNAVCSRVGNISYLFLFLFCEFVSNATHLVMSEVPAIGASGAINGVIGAYLMFFPINRIYCVWIVLIKFGTFRISGFWLILAWFCFDLLGTLGSNPAIAYSAHIGGFLAGAILGSILIALKRVDLNEFDNPHALNFLLPGIFGKHHHSEEIHTRLTAPLIQQPKYFLHCGGQQLGPHPISEIRSFMTSGTVRGHDLIFDPVLHNWRSIDDFFKG